MAQLKPKLDWLMMASRLLSLVEKLLPAFLVAWNNQLKLQNARLRAQLEQKQIDADVAAKKQELANDDKNPTDTINDFLKR